MKKLISVNKFRQILEKVKMFPEQFKNSYKSIFKIIDDLDCV